MAAKYQVIAGELAERIRRGDLGNRDRLPGELELAQEFAVSRGTVRQALATLQRNGMIQTSTGAGSFVTFDGEQIDDLAGWTEALAGRGVSTDPELLAFGRVELPRLATRLGLGSADFLLLNRLRSTVDGVPVSLERSRVPWRPSLETVLANGLVGGSLNATLTAHGLVGVGGDETTGVAVLGSEDAEILGREPGTPFLMTERTVYDEAGEIVEFVTSLLDPVHFRLRYTFGQPR